MVNHINALFSRVDQKLVRLRRLRPLPPVAVKKLQEKFQIEMTYNSNAIEGNSLTLKETFWVINEGITVKNKPLKDHLEAKDHHEALEFLYELVRPQKKVTVSEKLVRELHSLIMKKTEADWAGRYRKTNVFIAGSNHTPPDASAVSAAMNKLISWLGKNRHRLHPIELAARLHHQLVFIHPFLDGNGRTARLVMNLILMRKAYPLAVILKNDRQKYYRVLQEADKNNYQPLIRFAAQTVERSLDIYLKTLTPTTKPREKFYPLAIIAKKTSFSAKYLNLLARQGKLAAYKEKRNWLTSLAAVKRYLDSRERKR
ncbi:MAG: Filamentation induced by cAMP protein Fic [Candidatus Beckwithbacteria bacterium GW2011_GWB1_47_15]|uniref:Filamentation induced by cAMP protein Fic n=1 Tax=Candidatus Beckwithbacteria bacterium GW2011_GWB1_47_15 TaxID=1618371 RepID=A0A0G1RTM1_9BACT|nr:MAG: filamentation induced by cAMP protein Fic [Candidatus Beckwithbacteria bacterium GW2011_GWC1_49_16]KKU34760.1 MAG: Filamentation induced by cAMP protein Fic [Candidatus Beckwithbacteria bacterium GW2011_GWA1_46_30]KKU60634.1 MAG: Filamentation induced by cAMP protein Fic [Candidatus Beckwithbacteria bacterium GW2011_GWB1_47_15]KKU72667.1 MAG: Filamentation induced by cAMP protein Fic [Candidatus Beckwithbacteria bacterium GW2011_GWA2_47_25]KKW02868.1 MAG: Filamentation induced by cAMP p